MLACWGLVLLLLRICRWLVTGLVLFWFGLGLGFRFLWVALWVYGGLALFWFGCLCIWLGLGGYLFGIVVLVVDCVSSW